MFVVDFGVVVEGQYKGGQAILIENLEGWSIAAGQRPGQGWRILVSVHDGMSRIVIV